MDDSNQIEPPPSFAAIYTSRDGARLTKPAQVVVQRYELCEDLAQALAEQAADMQFKSGGSEAEVLSRVRQTLLDAASPVTDLEVDWVVSRLAELAGWREPGRGSTHDDQR